MTHFIPLIGAAIKDRRAHLGITQDQMAEAAGISKVTAWKIENDLKKLGVRPELAERVARVLECEVSALAAGPPVPHPKRVRAST